MNKRAPSFKLRTATTTDERGIKAIIRAARINPMGVDWRHFIVAADEEGNLVGCGQVKSHGDGSRELASIAVVRAWRGHGIARSIIEQLVVRHHAPLWLTCRARLIPFYQKFDFVEVKDTTRMPPYFSRIKRLSHLFLKLLGTKEYLAVMVREI